MSDYKHDISEFIGGIPKEYYSIELPKLDISESVRNGLMKKNLSLRKAADLIEGMSYPQISRVTSGDNYNIDTLLKILDILDLEIEIKEKNR